MKKNVGTCTCSNITFTNFQQALIDVKRHQVQKYHKAKDGFERAEIELDPFVVFQKALENGKPKMHLKRVLRAGSVLQV